MNALPVRLPGRALRLPGHRVSLRLHLRPLGTCALLSLVVLALFVVAVGTGDVPVSATEVVKSLVGAGDPGSDFVVHELRLPRALCAVLVGAALGVSGAIFQAITRNPLGSPDIVGFQQGATAGALLVITVLHGSQAATSAGALIGGALAALLVYGLAFQRGSASGHRIVLVGIAVAALALAVVNYLLSRARVEDAQEATRWLLGSLNGRTWDDVRPLVIALLVLLPGALVAGRPLRALELGDDQARGLGLSVERARFGLVALAVGLISVTTTAVGPIAFVALTAPQIARRLSRATAPPLATAALTGAALVLGADVLAQRLIASQPLPVGVMTGALGGVHLLALLTLSWKRGRG